METENNQNSGLDADSAFGKFISLNTVDAKQSAKQNTNYKLDSGLLASDDVNYINPLGDDFDPANIDYLLDQQASLDITKILQDQQRSFSGFTKFNKFNAYRYFYKTNPLLGRAIDLHVDLPLSKLRLVPPKNVTSTLVKDYIYYFYESLFSRIDLFAFIRNFLLQYRIYGEAYALVEDPYSLDIENRELVSLNKINEIFNNAPTDLSLEDKEYIKNIDKKYELDKNDVSLKERLAYLKKIFPLINTKYKGPEKISVLDFYKINDYMVNSSSDYKAVSIKVDRLLRDGINELNEDVLQKFKLTKAFKDLLERSVALNEKDITLDNNPYVPNGNTSYIFDLGDMAKPSSLIHRVIDQAFEYECIKSAVRTKIQLIGKTGRIITAEGVSEAQLQALHSDIVHMSQNPDSEVVLNYNVNINEFNTNVKDDLKDLIADADRVKEEMSMGLGIPLSLLGGEQQFSGEVLRLEIMNNEYLNLKNLIITKIEEYILKPIAIRCGFIRTNEWGDVEPIYPSISFSRTSLRSESQYDVLFNLWTKSAIPTDIIYDLLNIDPDSAQKGIKKEMFTAKSPYFGDMMSSALGNISSELGQDKDVINKVRESLGLKIKQNDQNPDEVSPDIEEEDKLKDLNFR